MLAHKWKENKLTFPCFIQPKLNGVRGVYHPKVHKFVSRYGEIWKDEIVQHVLDELEIFRSFGIHFDGEFYSHGMSLQNINSRIAVVRGTPHAERDSISFYIFDVVLDEPFYRRHSAMLKLQHMAANLKHVKFVKTLEITGPSEADYYYNLWHNKEGFEGLMYRIATAPYGFTQRCGNKENRWHYLMKRKGIQDTYATVVGFNQMLDGDGNPKDTLGSFQLMLETGVTFNAGSGLTADDRAKYWRLGKHMLSGTKVRINFEMLSDSGVPLKPTIDCVEYVF